MEVNKVITLIMRCKKKIKVLDLGMIFKTSSRTSSSQIPETQSLVPGSRKSIVAIRRQHNVTDEMGVTIETFLRDPVVRLVAGQFPNNQGLV